VKTKPMVIYCECGSTMMEHGLIEGVMRVSCRAMSCPQRSVMRFVCLPDADEVRQQDEVDLPNTPPPGGTDA
jgi:hypothetical protein